MPVEAGDAEKSLQKVADEATLDALSEAIESGAGLPAVARAAGKALGASVALIDRSSAVLAVAAASSAEESKLLSGADDVDSLELRVADSVVGELRYRAKGGGAGDGADRGWSRRCSGSSSSGRGRPSGRATRRRASSSARCSARTVTDRGDIVARAAELGAEVEHGAGRARRARRAALGADGRLARAGAGGGAAGAAGRQLGLDRRRSARSTTAPR